MGHPDVVPSPRTLLGEGPIWNNREQALYLCDIRGHGLYRLSEFDVQSWSLPGPIGCFAFRLAGGMVLAMKAGLFLFDLATGELSLLADPEPALPDNRFNDGKCDRAGRFFAGTMQDFGGKAPSGSLYRTDAGRACTAVIAGLHVPNSICWSPDSRTFYMSDTPTGRIAAYEFDFDTGSVGKARTLLEPGIAPGKPDGATVDSDGCIWNARYGGGQVVRITPAGIVDRVVELPVSHVTSCAFGGPRLETLFVTTASYRLVGEPDRHPLAGRVFAFSPGVAGLPEPSFAG